MLKRNFHRFLLLSIIVGTSACGGTPSVNTSGEMTQHVQLGVSPDLANQIESMFAGIFGRAISSEELQYYANLFANGTTLSEIQSILTQTKAILDKFNI